MSRFGKLSHVIWHCQDHIAWTQKYRYKVLKGVVAQDGYVERKNSVTIVFQISVFKTEGLLG